MAKQVEKLVKLQIPAGKATPAPPVGPALGQAGVNIMGFFLKNHLVFKKVLVNLTKQKLLQLQKHKSKKLQNLKCLTLTRHQLKLQCQ